MNQKTLVTHQRSKMLIIILWASFILSNVAYVIAGNFQVGTLFVKTIILSVILCITVLNYKKKLILQIPYILSSIIFLVYILDLLSKGPGEENSVMHLFIQLVLIAIYPNYRPILILSILFLLGINWGFSNGIIIMDTSQLNVNIIFSVVSAALIFTAKLNEDLYLTAERGHNATLEAKQQVENVLFQTQNFVEALNKFSYQFKDNVTRTGQTSKEVTYAFSEVAKGIDSQAVSINEITDSIKITDEQVQSVSLRSQQMRLLSMDTSKKTTEGNQQLYTLMQRMNHISDIVQRTVELMNDLQIQNNKIDQILANINDISKRTNILSLNAAIEAARAGEQGRGFAVLSSEVRKLAIISHESTDEIAHIIDEIQSKTNDLTNHINSGMQALIDSQEATKQTESIFIEITDNANLLLSKSAEVETMAQELEDNSHRIVDEVTLISSVTQESSAAYEEIMASIEDQNQRIQQIVNEYSELEQLAHALRKLTLHTD